jgi:hypothetical protein
MTYSSSPASANPAAGISKQQRWAGRVLTGLAGAFMLFDGGFKLVTPMPQAVIDSFNQLGYNPSISSTLGILSLACTILYLIPRTAVLGAILLTGYFGGAIATHLRVEQPLFTHVLFPTYVAVLVWGGLFLRDERVRALFRSRARTA